jgi:hypothetical protein
VEDVPLPLDFQIVLGFSQQQQLLDLSAALTKNLQHSCVNFFFGMTTGALLTHCLATAVVA